MSEFTDAPRRPPGAVAPSEANPRDVITIRPIDHANVRAVCDLRVSPEQRPLVGPAAYTVAEGVFEPGALLRAICQGPVPVGVLLVETDRDAPYLVRFLVDTAVQGRGIGRAAVELTCAALREGGWSSLEVTFQPVDGGAQGFWERCGFSDTGRVKDGEPVYVRAL